MHAECGVLLYDSSMTSHRNDLKLISNFLHCKLLSPPKNVIKCHLLRTCTIGRCDVLNNNNNHLSRMFKTATMVATKR